MCKGPPKIDASGVLGTEERLDVAVVPDHVADETGIALTLRLEDIINRTYESLMNAFVEFARTRSTQVLATDVDYIYFALDKITELIIDHLGG